MRSITECDEPSLQHSDLEMYQLKLMYFKEEYLQCEYRGPLLNLLYFNRSLLVTLSHISSPALS